MTEFFVFKHQFFKIFHDQLVESYWSERLFVDDDFGTGIITLISDEMDLWSVREIS